MKTILYLTDLYYKANGRDYYKEDLFLTSILKDHFNILIGHPHQAISLLNKADFIVFRNAGPVIYFQDYFDQFVQEVHLRKITTFNSFDGKADMKGKQYLLNLTNEGFPVIPTIENVTELDKLGHPDKYILKLKNGADSIGMESISQDSVQKINLEGKLLQPYLHFQYEVSFYFLNNDFQYALYAPDKHKRWELQLYQPSSEDLSFANTFIRWNNLHHGITRVDACRLNDGSLLLVELEDLNPFLSIDLLPETLRNSFINNWINILKQL